MIQRLNLHLPLNTVSLGQVSFNILRELYRRKIQCVLYPRGPVDLSAYKIDAQFGQWIERAVNTRLTKLDRKVPTFCLWHISDSQFRISDRQVLFSFHETDSPTETEINLVNQQDATLFSSNWSVENFSTFGAQNVSFVPLGLDEDFKPIAHRLVSPDITHWILVGKAEQRKNTQLIIQTWIKRYGGRREHQLTLCVHNQFFQPGVMDQFYASCFPDGKKPFNVNVLPQLKTNAEMNQLYNSADIDLSGFSGAEGWGIPSHTCTALGKWSIVSNCSAHKDWATAANSILVEPAGVREVYDGAFFQKGAAVSQGNIYALSVESLNEAMDRAEKVAKTPNVEGAKLREQHTYAKMVDAILAKVEAVSA